MKKWRRRGGLGPSLQPTLTLLEMDPETVRYSVGWSGGDPYDWVMEYSVNGGGFALGPIIPGTDRIIDESIAFGNGDVIVGRLHGRNATEDTVLGPVESAAIVWTV